MINKDKCKSLVHKNGNDNPIWSWNGTCATLSVCSTGHLGSHKGVFLVGPQSGDRLLEYESEHD